ncbi:hypothetical protein GCM10009839_21630 [Catenulispora yoronensis]|uniref:Uncharacterized protein n=1 Tax=Catenulispora yoronensis TaxID=450799 RepID=A0ABN2TXM6_9ACTN
MTMKNAGRTRQTRRTRRIAAATATALVLGTALTAAPSASADINAPNVVNIYFGGGGNTFYNYDFHSTSGVSSNIDWGIDLVFSGGGANIPALRSVVNKAGFNGSGSGQYGFISDIGQWDMSTGEKQGSGCTWPDSYHMRQYARNVYSSYDSSIGFYVVASTHNDHYENCGGYSEEDETSKHVFSGAFRNAGYAVNDDYWGLSNTQEGTDAHGKRWDNTGWASWIHM